MEHLPPLPPNHKSWLSVYTNFVSRHPESREVPSEDVSFTVLSRPLIMKKLNGEAFPENRSHMYAAGGVKLSEVKSAALDELMELIPNQKQVVLLLDILKSGRGKSVDQEGEDLIKAGRKLLDIPRITEE